MKIEDVRYCGTVCVPRVTFNNTLKKTAPQPKGKIKIKTKTKKVDKKRAGFYHSFDSVCH